MTAELFKLVTGTRITHIPYKGTGDAVRDLLGGQVQIMFGAPGAVIQQIRAGKLRAIGALSPKRLSELKDVPTAAESGYPGIEAANWYAILAPAGTPVAVVNQLNQQIGHIMQSPEVKELLFRQGYETTTSTPQELGALLKNDLAKWSKVVKASGMHID
jgi:tripartite-type tricarboxylate transporter receptor subunit TctC